MELLCPPSRFPLFLWSAPVAFRRVALETFEWTSRDSNHHRQSRQSVGVGLPTEPWGRLRPLAFLWWLLVQCSAGSFLWACNGLVVMFGMVCCDGLAPFFTTREGPNCISKNHQNQKSYLSSWLSWYRGVLDVADRLPVVVRFPAGPRVRFKTVDPPKGNGLGQKKNASPKIMSVLGAKRSSKTSLLHLLVLIMRALRVLQAFRQPNNSSTLF